MVEDVLVDVVGRVVLVVVWMKEKTTSISDNKNWVCWIVIINY